MPRSIARRLPRSKAHPDEFPGHGPTSIRAAYDELSQEAFAVWMRMTVEEPSRLRGGRPTVARILGYSRRRSDVILGELERKGYISFVRTLGMPTEVVLERKLLVQRAPGVVRIGNALTFAGCDFSSGPDYSCVVIVKNNTVQSILPLCPTCHNIVNSNGVCYCTQPTNHTAKTDKCLLSTLGNQDQQLQSRCKFVDESGAYFGSRPRAGVNLAVDRKREISDRYRQSKEQVKERIRAERSEARARTNQSRSNGPDWSKLDQYGSPVVSFDPGARDREVVLEVLSKRPNDSNRVRLIRKIETEFSRIYTRYRRDAERRLGRPFSTYEVDKRERKWASEAGIQCIRKGVTPRQLLEHWDSEIRHFADGAMAIPPLHFLASPANVDRVACTLISIDPRRPRTQQRGRYREPEIHTDKPINGNSYGGALGLDTRLRKSLEDSGFTTQEYSDRYMLSVQHNAVSMAAGRRIFMGEGKAKQMAEWAAENLYAE